MNYVTLVSKVDISYVVNMLARFSNNPSELHWRAVKHVMKYLKSTSVISLTYNEGTNDELVGYSNSDYASDLTKRKSTSGYVFMLNGRPIAWLSSLQ